MICWILDSYCVIIRLFGETEFMNLYGGAIHLFSDNTYGKAKISVC